MKRKFAMHAGGIDIKIESKDIKNINQIKLLGVNIDENKNFVVHV